MLNCGCNNAQTGSLADKDARNRLQTYYKTDTGLSTIDKIVGNPLAVGTGIAVGGFLTFAGLKFAKRIR